METLARAANRGSIATGAAYEIDNSLKLEPDNAERIRRSGTTATNRKKFTVSFWVKRTEITSTYMVLACDEASGNDISFLSFESDDVLRFRDTSSAANQCILETNRVFRDTSAWYHIVLAVDTTLATADNRNRIYVNGVEETSFSARTNFDLNDTPSWGGYTLTFGNALAEANYYAGYVTEAIYVDGQQLTPTDFGEFDEDTGIWKPIEYTGTFGNNGYYLKFNNAADLGEDANGGTSFTLYNITSVDQATDTPTNNFCTLNPLIVYGYPCTISQGAVKASDNSVGLGGAAGTFAVNKGKWYWEFQTNGANTIVGVQDIEAPTYTSDNAHEMAYTMGLYLLGEYNLVFDSGGTRNDGAVSGFVHANANFYGIALNMDDNEIEYYVNGVKKGPTFSLDALSDLYVRPFVSSSSSILYFNFGAIYPDPISTGNTDDNGYGNFEHAPPSGYYALCSKNLAEFG